MDGCDWLDLGFGCVGVLAAMGVLALIAVAIKLISMVLA